MRKRIFTVLTVLGLTLGLALATPASASPSAVQASQQVQTIPVEMLRGFGSCPSGVGCVFADEGGTGLYIPLAFSYYGWSCWSFPEHGFANDDNESAANKYGSGLRLRFYKDARCSGSTSTVANWSTTDWVWLHPLWNGASSFQILPA